jgi:hypothetical protein
MTAPRRWLEDPEADTALRDLVRGASPARSLDAVTRRRLGAKVARTSALPVAAAGWLFVKSATAALSVVLGTGAVAVSAGIVEWGPPQGPVAGPRAPAPLKPRVAAPRPAPPPRLASPPEEPVASPTPQLNPTPTLPVDSSGSNRLSEEAALLEGARAKLRVSPAEALALASQHGSRFPRGQLASERKLIQIDALHRLGRDSEARAVARELLRGAGAGLYAERVRQLLGADAAR